MIHKLHLKPFVLNLREEKLGNSLECIDTGDYFLNKTLIVQALRSTINKRDLTKPERSWKAENMGKRKKRLLPDWKNNFP